MTQIRNNWIVVVGGKGSSWLRLAGDTRWPVLAVAARGVGSTAGIDERTAQARCHSRRRQPTAHWGPCTASEMWTMSPLPGDTQWFPAEIRRLINAVKKHETIFNPRHDTYGMRDSQNRAWRSVAELVGNGKTGNYRSAVLNVVFTAVLTAGAVSCLL